MLDFLSGKIGFFAIIVIPILIIAGLILQSVQKNIKGELNKTVAQLAKAEKEKEEADKEKEKSDKAPDAENGELLDGFETLTKADYEEMYNALKSELWKEMENRGE